MNKSFLNKKICRIYNDVNTKGFSKIKLFSKNDIENFFKKKIVLNLNKRQLLNKKFDKLDIPYYHKIVSNDLIHKKLIDPGKRKVKLSNNITRKIKNNPEIRFLIEKSWNTDNFEIRHYFKKKIIKNCAAYRMARPFKYYKDDVGGAHLDLHFNNKIYRNHKILYTIWVPVTGFNKKYTLRLSPKSHKKNHSTTNLKKQSKYISKVFKESYLKKFKFTRLNMRQGEVLIFHPNLLHGGSINLGNKTRASYDLRIYNNNIKKL